jgi:RNA polymerase sigma-70 factor, ECF subfamily
MLKGACRAVQHADVRPADGVHALRDRRRGREAQPAGAAGAREDDGGQCGEVYRFVLRLTNNPTLSEDIVSEVFIGVWRQAGGFKGNSQVSTWLLAIARNKALSALRRRVDDHLDDAAAATIADASDDAETMIDNGDRSALVRKCMSQLSAEHREVLDLVYYHEKSVQEVARIVGVPASTVKTRMFYARKRMEKLFARVGFEAR